VTLKVGTMKEPNIFHSSGIWSTYWYTLICQNSTLLVKTLT